MPPTQTPIQSGPPTPEQDSPESRAQTPASTPDSDAPLSFVPHDPGPQAPVKPIRIRTNRYGELEEHELVHLLDTIEDERARGRFRESIYISVFFWLVVAWLIFYGPRVLWHAPVLINPADVLKNRELTQLNVPTLSSRVPVPRPVAKAPDSHTLDRLRERDRERPTPAPAPPPPTPTPAPANATPTPPTPIPPTPQPRTPTPPLADAPTPQPATKPDFNTNSGTAGDDIRRAERGSLSGGGGDFARSPSKADNFGGVEVLSDTHGINISDYLRRLKSDIYRNWIPLLPVETEPPLSKQGETYIRFTILPDGRIGDMHLEGSTHDDAINKAAWGSITSEGQFPPLPKGLPNLELRFLYLVNEPLR